VSNAHGGAGNGTVSAFLVACSGSAAAGAVDVRLSPDGSTLLVDGCAAKIIASFAVNGGELTELASSPTPLPVDAFAAGIVTTDDR
jgi:hypothetical protein